MRSAKSVAEGKIPRFKVLSCRQGSVWSRACNQRVFMIGKQQPLHCFLRNADGTTQVDSRIDRLTPLNACTRVAHLTFIYTCMVYVYIYLLETIMLQYSI
ncbi:Hypothetical_protein [Hexamita inflata]|uniref:Hypothetical_protein n=1 Tax=Hexamita inflata TaxID=28002 RepID=A0AA86QJF2_9EUKA|nr:Hypothetical protein HINF_LOCUS44876 [Hexamita inflata]